MSKKCLCEIQTQTNVKTILILFDKCFFIDNCLKKESVWHCTFIYNLFCNQNQFIHLLAVLNTQKDEKNYNL